MPILLKLYRCFCHDLKICMWFGYYPEIIFCHFFCNLNLVIMAGDINSLNLLVKCGKKPGCLEKKTFRGGNISSLNSLVFMFLSAIQLVHSARCTHD